MGIFKKYPIKANRYIELYNLFSWNPFSRVSKLFPRLINTSRSLGLQSVLSIYANCSIVLHNLFSRIAIPIWMNELSK